MCILYAVTKYYLSLQDATTTPVITGALATLKIIIHISDVIVHLVTGETPVKIVSHDFVNGLLIIGLDFIGNYLDVNIDVNVLFVTRGCYFVTLLYISNSFCFSLFTF